MPQGIFYLYLFHQSCFIGSGHLETRLKTDIIFMKATDPIAGIVLAAGMSKRFGRPKQLLQIGKAFLINRVVDAALNSCLDAVIVVLGHQH